MSFLNTKLLIALVAAVSVITAAAAYWLQSERTADINYKQAMETLKDPENRSDPNKQESFKFDNPFGGENNEKTEQ